MWQSFIEESKQKRKIDEISMATVNMKNTKTDDNEPILDPKLMEQLRMELYGTGLVDDDDEDSSSSVLSQTKISTSTATSFKNLNMNVNGSMLVIGASVIGLLGMQVPFLFIKHAPFMATPGRKIQDAIKFLNLQKAAVATSSTRTTLRVSVSQAAPGAVAPKPKPPIFVDLGSGDGQAVYEAAKLGHTAVGIEFNWTLWALSSLRRLLFWPLEVKRRSRFLLQDFSHYDLKDANTVMIFAVPRTMPILGRKIQSECSPGTNIMAYRFEMPLATSISTGSSDSSSRSNVDVTTKQQKKTTNTIKNGNGSGDKNQEDSDRTSDGNDETEDEDEDLRLRATCIYDREEMRIYRMGE